MKSIAGAGFISCLRIIDPGENLTSHLNYVRNILMHHSNFFQTGQLLIAALIILAFSTSLTLAQWDKQGIEFVEEMQHDSSTSFLKIPSDPQSNDFKMAQTAPAIDFAIQQFLEPWDPSTLGGIWGGWGEATLGPDNCFYYSFGNHADYGGGRAYILKYDPVKREQSMVLNSSEVAGWTNTDYADGKLHGNPDVSPDGQMWLLSFFGEAPPQSVIDAGDYKGGILIHHDINTGESEYLGQPVYGLSWVYHAWDWNHDVLFAVNHWNDYVMAYDTENREIIFHGKPHTLEGDAYWYSRCMLVDRETGKFYSTDMNAKSDGTPNKGTARIICYDPAREEFQLMKSRVPAFNDGKHYPIRSYTSIKDKDGAFWCTDYKGQLFRFFPEQDSMEVVGTNWGTGKYMSSLCFSPDMRYIYYTCDASTMADRYGTPVVQYDIFTGAKKVLAFIRDYYVDKYGYNPGGTYGVQVDSTGKYLFFYVNGKFTDGNSWYGRPSIYCLNIPETERSLSAGSPRMEYTASFELEQPYPNPFSEQISMEIQSNSTSDIHVTVYNTAGQVVKQGKLNSIFGRQMFTWDGSDMSGQSGAPGLYHIRVSQDGQHRTRTVQIIR